MQRRKDFSQSVIDSTEKRSRKDAEAQSFQSKNLRESAKSVVFSEESVIDPQVSQMTQIFSGSICVICEICGKIVALRLSLLLV
jgi:hypothetical protein